MMSPMTAGLWSAAPLRPSSASWPFDWVTEITAIDPQTRRHQMVARVVQAGTRPRAEATANVAAISNFTELVRLLRAVAAVIDMSDPDHEAFADSAADCLDALLTHQADIRRVLAAIEQAGLRAVPSALKGGQA